MFERMISAEWLVRATFHSSAAMCCAVSTDSSHAAGERQLAGVVFLEPVAHQRVIGAGLRGQALQAALASEVRESCVAAPDWCGCRRPLPVARCKEDDASCHDREEQLPTAVKLGHDGHKAVRLTVSAISIQTTHMYTISLK